jgi:lipoate-protein ligase A
LGIGHWSFQEEVVMAAQQVRLLPYQVVAGAWQMAADELMLEQAATGWAALRFYGWPEATLSLGYFQSAAECQAYPGLGDRPMVRRATGGETLVHDREVTYALALPAGPPWQKRGESWPHRMHTLIARALATFGVEAHLCEQESKNGRVLCFLHQTPGDLLIGPHKVTGSAQRKMRGAMLQHGGILLEQSPTTPELPGIHELSGVNVTAEQLMSALLAELRRALGWAFVPEQWTDADKQRIGELIASRYGTEEWNRKR